MKEEKETFASEGRVNISHPRMSQTNIRSLRYETCVYCTDALRRKESLNVLLLRLLCQEINHR